MFELDFYDFHNSIKLCHSLSIKWKDLLGTGRPSPRLEGGGAKGNKNKKKYRLFVG